MTTQEIATRLVELCRKGDYDTAQRELYADNAISIEPESSPAFDKETKGLDAIVAKGEKWQAMVEETHSLEVSDPVVANNAFACTFMMDVTIQGQGRMKITELGVYKVKDGKVVSEEFMM